MARKYFFWKELNEDYAVVSSINQDALVKALDEIIGERSIDKFAKESGVNPMILYRTYSGERTMPIDYEKCEKMYKHRQKNCLLSFDDLLAANGMLRREKYEENAKKADEILAYLDTLPGRGVQTPAPRNSSKKDEDITLNPDADAAAYGFDVSKLTHSEFIKDLAYYSMAKPKESLIKLHRKQDEIFADKNLVKILHLYHIKSIEGKEGKNAMILRNYGINPESRILSLYDNTALEYKKLLNTMLDVK